MKLKKYKYQLVWNNWNHKTGSFGKNRMIWHDGNCNWYYQTKNNNKVIWQKVKHEYKDNWRLDN